MRELLWVEDRVDVVNQSVLGEQDHRGDDSPVLHTDHTRFAVHVCRAELQPAAGDPAQQVASNRVPADHRMLGRARYEATGIGVAYHVWVQDLEQGGEIAAGGRGGELLG